MNGTLLAVEAHNAVAVQAFINDDPCMRHGVNRDFRPWRCGPGPVFKPMPTFIERP